MTPLDEMIRDILGRLELLAEGPTQSLDPDKGMHQHAESQVPAGAAIRSSDKAPDKRHVSLYEWYSWHFAHNAGDPARLRSLYLLAVTDYMEFRYRVPRRVELRKGELDERDAEDPGASERAAAKRVVDWYEGKPALYVAMLENQTEAWVRKARRNHNRRPDDGYPLPEFYGWSEKVRRARVALAEEEGLSKEAAARRFGVDRKTVDRYWPARPATLAA